MAPSYPEWSNRDSIIHYGWIHTLECDDLVINSKEHTLRGAIMSL